MGPALITRSETMYFMQFVAETFYCTKSGLGLRKMTAEE